jgi:hypothetical protein
MLLVATPVAPAWAAWATPLFTDINENGGVLAFDATQVSQFSHGYYDWNDMAQLNGNDVLLINQLGYANTSNNGVTVGTSISNGENGIDSTNNGLNSDIPNPTPADPVFAAIGNPTGRLENGNVIRVSAWFRSDPANPITLDPTVQPILAIDFWKEAHSDYGDFNGPHPDPYFGDRLFNQDQQRMLLDPSDKAQWIDFNGDGVVADTTAQAEGRVQSISTSAWTLVESVYKVDAAAHFVGIGAEKFGAGNVSVIESITVAMFLGEFEGRNLSGDGNGGNLLMDNFLLEVFRDQASVTPNTNPNPDGVAGDFDNDGDVDGRDFLIWQRGASPAPLSAADLAKWQGAYGALLVAAVSVPEPSTTLLGLGCLGLALRIRSRLRLDRLGERKPAP